MPEKSGFSGSLEPFVCTDYFSVRVKLISPGICCSMYYIMMMNTMVVLKEHWEA
jgi:hypothetical protein